MQDVQRQTLIAWVFYCTCAEPCSTINNRYRQVLLVGQPTKRSISIGMASVERKLVGFVAALLPISAR